MKFPFNIELDFMPHAYHLSGVGEWSFQCGEFWRETKHIKRQRKESFYFTEIHKNPPSPFLTTKRKRFVGKLQRRTKMLYYSLANIMRSYIREKYPCRRY